MSNVAAFPEPAEFFPKKVVDYTFSSEKILQIFSLKMRKFTPGKASHIDNLMNIVGMENLYEILFAPPACSECIDLFHNS